MEANRRASVTSPLRADRREKPASHSTAIARIQGEREQGNASRSALSLPGLKAEVSLAKLMTDIEETIKRNEELCQKMTALLREADAAQQQSNQIFADRGITREAAQRYIASTQVSPEARQQACEETAKLTEELDAEERRIEAQYLDPSTVGRVKKIRTHRLV